ncbi:MAG: SLC13 family permease [Nitrospirae bacterium]|nr:SLC13 family permease [Nitrospirota bacterium]
MTEKLSFCHNEPRNINSNQYSYQMNIQLLLIFIILIADIGLFLSDRMRPDLIALLTVVTLGLTGILTPHEAFSGFSRSAVITILAIFILTDGLRRTGVTEQVGNLLAKIAGTRERWLVLIVMSAGAFLSLFMNNIAATSVLLPVVSEAGHKAGVKPARTLMPLAFATILGGMATLLTTTNIVVSSLLRDHGLAGYGLLDFAPIGLPVVIIGVIYMVFVGRRMLPAQTPAHYMESTRRTEGDLIDIYRLGERLFRIRIPLGSVMNGKTLAQSAFRERYNFTAVAINRNDFITLAPTPDYILQQGDIILFTGKVEDLEQLDMEPYFEILPPLNWSEQDLESPAIVITEAVLAPRSVLIGQTLRQAHFRDKYGMTVLAVWRGGQRIRTSLTDLPLQFGDALLMQGPRERLRILHTEPDIILLANGKEKVKLVPGKGRLALIIMCIVLLVAALQPTIVGEAMLGGALAMVLLGVLTMDHAYQSVEWKTIFLVAGMLPMGIAITKTGAASLLAEWLIQIAGPAGPLALLVGLFWLTVLLTQAMNGAAVAAIMAPIAIQAARNIGANPRSMVMGVALATSMAFMTPLGHPVNLMIIGPGGYRFRDFLKVGLPLTLLLFITIIILFPLFWPLIPK